jgi:hypothetical protein
VGEQDRHLRPLMLSARSGFPAADVSGQFGAAVVAGLGCVYDY